MYLVTKLVLLLFYIHFSYSYNLEGANDELSQELNYSVRKIVEKLSVIGPHPQFIIALTEVGSCLWLFNKAFNLSFIPS